MLEIQYSPGITRCAGVGRSGRSGASLVGGGLTVFAALSLALVGGFGTVGAALATTAPAAIKAKQRTAIITSSPPGSTEV